MTSNPTFTERNIANGYLLDSRLEQKSLVTYLTLPSLYVCVWLVNTLTSTAPIGSPIIRMWWADICEQRERNLSFGSADVSGAGTCDELLRTSVFVIEDGHRGQLHLVTVFVWLLWLLELLWSMCWFWWVRLLWWLWSSWSLLLFAFEECWMRSFSSSS